MNNTIGICFLTKKDYNNIFPPFHPPEHYYELDFLPPQDLNPANQIYSGVRRLFFLLGLDVDRFDSQKWNPLGDLVQPGNTVVIKPNLVRHYNGSEYGTIESVVTHSSILRPVIDYCLKALDFKGRIVIVDAPQQDCDIEILKDFLGFEQLRKFYQQHYNFELEFIDLREEFVKFKNSIINERIKLNGDSLGYSIIDLGEDSAFHQVETQSRLFRGADYDEEETIIHHGAGKHEYLISNTILTADLVINIPKIKTHKKAGVTLSLKNLIGINGNKNWLPHHRMGFPEENGDEFPTKNLQNTLRGYAVEKARHFLKQGKLRRLFQFAKKAENFINAAPSIRNGNWYGNDTIWRTIVDLNKILFFADKHGKLHNELYTDRRYLAIFDGVVAGEENGPMEPINKPLGLICGGFDPILLDIATVQLMGFDWTKIPKIYYSTKLAKYRYTTFTDVDDIKVNTFDFKTSQYDTKRLSELTLNFHFKPHHGWKGHIEIGQ